MDYTPLKPFAIAVRTRLLTAVDQQLTMVVAADSWARRESPAAVAALEQAIASHSRAVVIESIAYTWFNRFTALRYFDLQGWNQPAVVSPAATGLQPEVLDLAKQDIYPEALSPAQRTTLVDLLSGRITSANRDEQVYRVLFFDACHTLHRSLPFLFEPIADYTELLLPNDLLTSQSILADIRTALTPDLCTSVEVLGWLYQYYISERKDAVMAAKAAVKTSDIPAVTQLFTPNWIVRYLVENSLGRLWLRSHPNSTLRDHMQYYVPDDAQSPAPATLTVQSPEEILLIDPACGSGHMLVYAFDLLVKIYEEQGYAQRDIPRLILTHNLHGIDLCPRAAQLAALALVIKARSLDPSFLRANRAVAPHVTLLADLTIPTSTLTRWGTMAGLPKASVERLVQLGEQFAQASTLGSLITPDLSDAVIAKLRASLPDDPACATLLAHIDVLSPRYHVVVANPPYMGNKGMNPALKAFMAQQFTKYKTDLFAGFMVRCTDMTMHNGYLGFMTPFVWMFISSYEELRQYITTQQTLLTLVQLEYSGFDGATVPICTFAFQKGNQPTYKGGYVRLSDFRGSENQAPKTLEAISNPACGWFFRASASDFAAIPGSPIAYWLNDKIVGIFNNNSSLSDNFTARQGLATTDNNKFVRLWYEVDMLHINFANIDRANTFTDVVRWYPYNKGGEFRKWWGNQRFVVNWQNDGEAIKDSIIHKYPYLNGKPGFVAKNPEYYFRESISFSKVGSGFPAFRYFPTGFIFDVAGSSIFFKSNQHRDSLVGFLNTYLVRYLLQALAPTLNIEIEQINSLPLQILDTDSNVSTVVESLMDNNPHETR
jgi:hypothetical protein